MSAVLNLAGPDAGAPWHYGDPLGEQRALERGEASVDLSHRPVFSLHGPERLTFLHAMASQHLADLASGEHTNAFVLDTSGRILHVFGGVDDGETFWGHTEPGRLDDLLEFFTKMRFRTQVEIADASVDRALIIGPRGPQVVERTNLEDTLGERRAGTWAAEALRIAAGQPRIFLDTDALTIPNELYMPDGDRLGPAVHMNKGCYRGQETVGRTYTMGRPPRRLTLLHLDGSTNELPPLGTPLTASGVEVGLLGTTAVHHELGPIGLALIKRGVPLDDTLDAAGVAASQQAIVDPEVGLHFRPPTTLQKIPGRKLG